MSKELIESTAGRDLDAQIAEKLFGWQWATCQEDAMLLLCPNDYHLLTSAEQTLWRDGRNGQREYLDGFIFDALTPVPAYSTTWEGVGLISAEMQQRGFSVSIYGPTAGDYPFSAAFAPTKNNERWIDWGDVAGTAVPEAIAWAALVAIGNYGERVSE